MKELFKGFYTPSEKEIKKSWSEEKTLFVFDTSVLLNLYRYTETTRNDFFQVINKISDKVWIPYHVGLEYQRNRLNVIKTEKEIFSNLNTYLKQLEKNIETTNLQKLNLKQRLPELDIKTKKLQDNINKLIESYKKEVETWNKKQPDVRSSDKIRKQIDKVFNKKIGNAPENQEWLQELYKEGEKRYTLKVPPGYMDKQDKQNKDNYKYSNLEYIPMYGDLIIWKQILIKIQDEDIDSLIFVTDDVKEDWWYILNSNGEKEIGARAELRDEVYKNSDISSFELLRTTDFMKKGQELLELSVKETSINEAKTNFEDTQLVYNSNADQVKNIDYDNRITPQEIDRLINKFPNKNTFDFILDKSYENNLEKWEKIYKDTIDNNRTKTLLEKLEEFDLNKKPRVYDSLLKELEDEEKEKNETRIARLLKEIKKLEDK